MKPALFIASSSESYEVASALQEGLEHAAEVTTWSQGVFKLSRSNIESLIDALEISDFGAFVFSPDDVVTIRGKDRLAVRDNVIFELGLFIGKLGRERCFVVMPRGHEDETHLPSDLLGLNPAVYEASRQDGNLVAALGPVASKIVRQIKNLEKKAPNSILEEESESPLSSEGDIKAMLQSWMGSRPAFENSQIIKFSDVDKELRLPPGSTKTYIVEIAKRWDYVPSQIGDQTVLFTTAPPRQRFYQDF